MAREVFTNKEVFYFFQANYISVKIDAEKGEGVALAKKYSVNAFPTLVFLDKEGNLINKLSGGLSSEQLIYEAKKSLSPDIKKLNEMIKVYKSGNMNVNQKIEYLQQLSKVKMDCSDILYDILTSLPKHQFLSKKSLKLLYYYCPGANDKNFTLLVNNYKDFSKVGDKKFLDKWIFGNSLFQCYRNKKTNADNNILLDKLRKVKYPYVYHIKEVYDIVMKIHNPNSADEVIKRGSKIMNSYPETFPSLMNEVVKAAYKNKKLMKFVDEKVEWMSDIDKYAAKKVCANMGCLLCLNARDYKNGLKYYSWANRLSDDKNYLKDVILRCKRQLGLAKCETYGKVLPEFKLTDINGKTVSLKDFKGKYVLIDFWASWCGPCKGEMPYLKNIYNKYKNKGLVVISISCDKGIKQWKKAVAMEKMNWIQLHDPNSIVFDQNGVRGIPRILLLDKQGKIIGDKLRGELIEKQITKVLK